MRDECEWSEGGRSFQSRTKIHSGTVRHARPACATIRTKNGRFQNNVECHNDIDPIKAWKELTLCYLQVGVFYLLERDTARLQRAQNVDKTHYPRFCQRRLKKVLAVAFLSFPLVSFDLPNQTFAIRMTMNEDLKTASWNTRIQNISDSQQQMNEELATVESRMKRLALATKFVRLRRWEFEDPKQENKALRQENETLKRLLRKKPSAQEIAPASPKRQRSEQRKPSCSRCCHCCRRHEGCTMQQKLALC